VAQTVVKMVLEPPVEPCFHPDSYGYRPKRSALDAVAVARKRCWGVDWVIDLDIKAFFDSIRMTSSNAPWRTTLNSPGYGCT
jgi:RNA-directed DNA polymerase